MGIVANANSQCVYAFFLDGANAQLNGAHCQPAGTFATLFSTGDSNGGKTNVVANFDASGAPTSVTANGVPFLPVPFPSTSYSGGSQCQPAVINAFARLTVGGPTATAASAYGVFVGFSVA